MAETGIVKTSIAKQDGAVDQRGRPSKITPKVTERICAALGIGATRKDAALFGGVSYETFRRWVNRGEEELIAAEQSDYETISEPAAFYWFVMKAEAEICMRLTKVICDAALNDPYLALKWLERRRRQEWGYRINVSDLSTQQLVDLLEYIED